MLGLGTARSALRAIGRWLPGNGLRVSAARLGGVEIGRGTTISRGVRLSNGCRIGPSCRVGRQAELTQVTLAAGCTIGAFARVARLIAGEGSHIETGVTCIGAREESIVVGRQCYVGVGALLDHSSELTLGDFVHIAGPSAAIHTHSSVPMTLKGCRLDEDGRQYGEVRIGGHTWIGGLVTVYPGTTIGDHCVVLPNSVVTSDVESHTMVGGVPARIVRRISVEEGKILFKP